MIGLLLAGLALDPGPALAPSPVDLLAAAAELDRRLDGAEAAARALGRVHTALAEAERKAGRPPACDDPAVVALLPRTAPLGMGVRSWAQSARAQSDRLNTMQQAVTVAALIDAPLAQDLARLRERVSAIERSYAELIQVEQHRIGPIAARCAVPLAPGPGLSVTLPLPAAEKAPLVAILGLGGGLICPAGAPADGQMVLVSGSACYSAGACDCSPLPVAPAAVLGPEAR